MRTYGNALLLIALAVTCALTPHTLRSAYRAHTTRYGRRPIPTILTAGEAFDARHTASVR